MIRIPKLDNKEILAIHQASLRILSETGIFLNNSEGRSLLLDLGAREHIDRILLPTDLVEKCLANLPKSIKLIGRDLKKKIEFGQKSWYAHNVGGVPNVYDSEMKVRRPATRTDVAASARLLDALPNVDSVTPLYTPQDVPSISFTLWMTFETLRNTTKPVRAPGVQTALEVRALAELFQIACPQGEITVGISPISPLTFPDGITAAIIEAAKKNFILGPLPCPIMGATAPMTIAGAIAQQNAEVLATIVLAQSVSPGLPMIYKGRLSVMDPRTGLSVWGNPEIGLISAATAALGHYYGMPVDVYGFSTNSHTEDIQSGYERTLNAVIPVLARADEISGVGEMDGGICSSLAQIVIDDEILTSIHRLGRGFEINEDTLALDVIDAAMNGNRNYLIEDHTLRYLRSGEVLIPKLAVRESWAEWKNQNQQGLVVRAEAKSRELLNNHEVPLLSEKQISELEAVIMGFEQQFAD